MANVKNIIVGALAIVGATSIAERGAYAGGQAIANNIEYKVSKPSVDLNRSLEGIIIVTLPIGITNNNSFAITIDSFLGQIFYGEVYLSDIEIREPLTLNPEKYTKIHLTFAVDLNEALTDATGSFIHTGFTTLLNRLYLKGNIQILSGTFSGGVYVPIEMPIPIA